MVNQIDELVLGNGESVVHADDLLPVVSPTSATARNGERARDARSSKRWSLLGALASIVVGSVLIVDGVHTDPQTGIATVGSESDLGLAVMTIGTIVGAVGYVYFSYDEGRADRAAFATYDDGLRAQLQLCVNGLQVVPCEQLAPTATAR